MIVKNHWTMYFPVLIFQPSRKIFTKGNLLLINNFII